MVLRQSVVLLGFNRHLDTDIARIEQLSQKWDVFTVSRSIYNQERRAVNFEDEAHHLGAKFCDIGRGRKSQIVSLVRAKAEAHRRVHIYLDYWWCANNYYREAYGQLWLQTWVRELLVAGAQLVVLP